MISTPLAWICARLDRALSVEISDGDGVPGIAGSGVANPLHPGRAATRTMADKIKRMGLVDAFMVLTSRNISYLKKRFTKPNFLPGCGEQVAGNMAMLIRYYTIINIKETNVLCTKLSLTTLMPIDEKISGMTFP
jgi:hypothetical protein